MVAIECPRCSSRVNIPPAASGRTVRCLKCHGQFTAPFVRANRGHIAVLVGGAMLLGLVVLGLAGVAAWKFSRQEPLAEPLSPAHGDAISVDDVWRECRRVEPNEAAALKPFGGQRIKVAGVVDEVRFFASGRDYVLYLPGKRFHWLRCYFKPEDQEILARLQRGQTVVVEGVAAELGWHTHDWVLLGCRLVSP